MALIQSTIKSDRGVLAVELILCLRCSWRACSSSIGGQSKNSDLLDSHYAKEIWVLYEEGELAPETVLTGQFEESAEAAVDAVLAVCRTWH